MTDKQPEALRLADEMQNYWNERGPDAEAVAAELRRLHEEVTLLRDQNTELDRKLAEQEMVMQQALEALEQSRVFVTSREKIKHPEGTEWYDERITALRERLAQPEQEPPRFPTMLRKMWSGGEVQKWIDENWSKK